MLYNGVWEKSNKDRATESSQEAQEGGRRWGEAELGPNGRSWGWSCEPQAMQLNKVHLSLGLRARRSVEKPKRKVTGKHRRFILKSNQSPPTVLLMSSIDWALLVEGVWNLKVPSSFAVKSCPCAMGFPIHLHRLLNVLKLSRWMRLNECYLFQSPKCPCVWKMGFIVWVFPAGRTE